MRMSGPAQSRKWWSHHSWRYLQDVYNMALRDMIQQWAWCVRSMVGLDLKGPFQPK